MKAIHRHLFQDVYEWAGRSRDENYLHGLSRDEFATRAARIMVGLNGLHPFREGNGRTQRVFISELAKEAGHQLDFSCTTRERMIQASILGNDKNDPSMMQRLFREIIDPQRVAALSKAVDALDEHGFPWSDHYPATTEPGHKLDVHFAGYAGDQFMEWR